MPEAQSKAFWQKGLSEEERGRYAVESHKLICELPSETNRRDYDLFNVRLYENNAFLSLYSYAGNYFSQGAVAMNPTEVSTNNKAKAAIDTLFAQIASTDQRARFMVVDGKYKQRRRAREMQNFSDGLVHELCLHAMKQRAWLDAAILESGRGVLQFYRDGDRCAVQRALATEYAISPSDGMIDGKPRTLHRRRPVPRDKVMEDFGFPDAKENSPESRINAAIEGAMAVNTGEPGDNIEVFEAWHLPTSKKAKDGWHVIAVDKGDGTLLCEQYTKDYHESVFFGIEDAFTTTWGNSLMHQMRPLQIRINANEFRREKARRLCHSGHLYAPKEMKLVKSNTTNEIGSLWEGNGALGPQQIKFDNVTAEWTAAIERDGMLIFENNGISLAASQGETNAGLNASAASKREDTQKSDKRNAVRQQRWEQFHLECVKVGLGIVRDIVTHNANGEKRSEAGGYKVATPGKRGLTMSDWKDAAMDEDDYVLQIKPASPVPTDPAGLVAFGREMIEIGAWQPSQLAGFMQDLDADGRVNREQAQERQFEKMYESLLYDKVAAALPDEFTDLNLALKIGVEYLAQGAEDEVPDKHLERVRRYLKRCKAMGAKAQAAAQPPAAAAPGAPPVDPGMAEAAMAAPPALSVAA